MPDCHESLEFVSQDPFLCCVSMYEFCFELFDCTFRQSIRAPIRVGHLTPLSSELPSRVPTTQVDHHYAQPPGGSLQLASLLPKLHDSAHCHLLSDKDDQRSTDPHCTFRKALATRFGLHLVDPRLRPRRVMHLTLPVLGSTSSRSQLQ